MYLSKKKEIKKYTNVFKNIKIWNVSYWEILRNLIIKVD